MTRQITIVLTIDSDRPDNAYAPGADHPNFLAAAECGHIEVGQTAYLELQSGDCVHGTVDSISLT